MKYKVIIIGASFGGLNALRVILPVLPKAFAVPIVIVQHLGRESNNYMINHLDSICHLSDKEVEGKAEMEFKKY